MQTYRKIIKVFLASPGDLKEERKAAWAIVEEENRNHAHNLGYQIELVGWEDTVAQHQRAQSAINRDLDQCEYFVGVIWKRWGTPPGPHNTLYSSGFEEEYERAVQRQSRTSTPEISLLFKNISKDDTSDTGPQLSKVLEFKQRIGDEKKLLYQTFEDTRDFEKRFRSIIASFIERQLVEDASHEINDISRSGDGEENEKSNISSNTRPYFESDSKRFLEEIINRPSNLSEYEFSSTEIARFRLLANTLSHSENDMETLGVHDSNLIFHNLRNSQLSHRENAALLKSALINLKSETVPFWYWAFKQSWKMPEKLAFMTVSGDETQQKNSFYVLKILDETLVDLKEPLDRKSLINIWFQDNYPSDIKVVALDYLGECGSSEDFIYIDNFLDANETNISRAAVIAKIRILSRTSIVDALELICTREDVEIDENIIEKLLSHKETLGTSLLKKCLSNNTTSLRWKVAEELLERNALDADEAESLTRSTDARTRFIGAKALLQSPQEFSLSDARIKIVKPKKTGLFAIFSTPPNRDIEGEKFFEIYKHDILYKKSFKDLLLLRNNEGLYVSDATIACYDRYFKQCKGELSKNIKDQFSSFFDAKISNLGLLDKPPEEKIVQALRKEMLQNALAILCDSGSKSDLPLVRYAIRNNELVYSEKLLRFFERFGEWEDIELVTMLVNNFPSRRFLLLSGAGQKEDFVLAAKIILKHGAKRISDVFDLDMPSPLRDSILIEMPKKLFRSFDNQQIEELLRHKTESARKIAALKAVLCLTKTRLNKLLVNYTKSGNPYFYNVVFWLDLG